MKYKTIAIIFFFFLIIPFLNVNAVTLPNLYINDSLKECRIYQHTSKTLLPNGWEIHLYKNSYIDNHKTECEKLGYTYNTEILQGIIDPAYLVTRYISIGLTLLLIIIFSLIYLKTKNKKILIAIPIIIILFLMFYAILNFDVS